MRRSEREAREALSRLIERTEADAAAARKGRVDRECGRDPHELGWRRDIIGQSGDPSGRTWIKPDGTFYTFAPGVRMVVFEAPAIPRPSHD